MRNYQKHVDAEGGSYRLAVRNIVCHLDMMTDEQKAAINWHPEQSVSLAVMRVIAMDDYRATAKAVSPLARESGCSDADLLVSEGKPKND